MKAKKKVFTSFYEMSRLRFELYQIYEGIFIAKKGKLTSKSGANISSELMIQNKSAF